VHHDEALNEISVSLYGEVQKQIIESNLADDYGLVADFRETTTIYIERPGRTGEAAELLTSDSNPYMATVGLRVEPGPLDSGVSFVLHAEQRSMPLYVYKSERSFTDHMAQYVRCGLDRGLYGWQVTDCIVTLTRCDYYVGDGPAKPTVPMARTTSADFRMLTPLVLSQALEQAGTRVCEPMARLSIESSSRTVGDLLQAVVQLGGVVEETRVRGGLSTIEATMPAQRSRELQRQLPGLSGGEGTLEWSFGGYRPVQGRPPTQPSTAPRRS
jgi:ribosomal protection tetracycline resistance protein